METTATSQTPDEAGACAVQILRQSLLFIQACVPQDATAAEIEAAVNLKCFAGNATGWVLVNDGDQCLNGDPARVQCADAADTRVHVVLSC